MMVLGTLRKAGLVQGGLTVLAFFGYSRLQSSNAAGTFTLVAETVIPSAAEESRKRIAYISIAAHSSIISAYRTGTQVATLVVLAQCATIISKTHSPLTFRCARNEKQNVETPGTGWNGFATVPDIDFG
jgi:hypothetical protein